MKRRIPLALLLIAATLSAAPLGAADAPPAREPRDPRAAAWVEALSKMPPLDDACDGTRKFYAFLGDLYQAKTQDPPAARATALAAIARFAEYSAYLRDLPPAFNEVDALLAKAREQGAKDPMLDLVGTMNHCMAGRSYRHPRFKVSAMSAMCNGIRAEYGPGIPLMLAQLTVLHAATDGRFSSVDAFGRQSVTTALSMEALIQNYGEVAKAAAKKDGLQQGLLDCWLFAVNGNLGTDAPGVNPLGEPDDPRPTMFWFRGKRFSAKHDLFWNTDWSKFEPHPDLLRGLKAAQSLKRGWAARGGGYANTVSDEGARRFEAGLQAANEEVAAMTTPMGSAGALLQLKATGPACAESYQEALAKALGAGYGPHLSDAVQTATFFHLQRWGGNPRKNLRTLELLLDAAAAQERDDLAIPAIEVVATGVNALQTDDPQAWDTLLAKPAFREDLSALYRRALAYLAKRPEAWARARERYLFARHISILCAGGQHAPEEYAAAHGAAAKDASAKSPLLDPVAFRTRYGAGWREAFDTTMALGDPALGEKIAALRQEPWPRSAGDLAAQTAAWEGLLAGAKDPLTRPLLLGQARLRADAAAFADGKHAIALPFDAGHWSLDTPEAEGGALAQGPASRAVARLPLPLDADHGLAVDFDMVCRMDGPEICLQFLPFVPDKVPSFTGRPDDPQGANILVFDRGSFTSWGSQLQKRKDGGMFSTPFRGAVASVGDGEKVHVRMECWPDETCIWINGRLAAFHPLAAPPKELQLAFTSYAERIPGGAPSSVSGVKVAPLGKSPVPLTREEEIPWAQAALARDGGHESALMRLARAGKMPANLAPEVLARLRTATPNLQLDAAYKLPPLPAVKLAPVVRKPGEQWISTANSEEFDALAIHAADGNPKTGWHDTWRGWSGPFPQLLRVDFASARPVRGIRVQKRNDFDAPPARMLVETSADGATWTPQVWSDGWAPFKKNPRQAPAFLDIPFPQTVEARFMRLAFYGSNHVNGYVAVAEVAPLEEVKEEVKEAPKETVKEEAKGKPK